MRRRRAAEASRPRDAPIADLRRRRAADVDSPSGPSTSARSSIQPIRANRGADALEQGVEVPEIVQREQLRADISFDMHKWRR
jgi:hypothetical protein